jgi:predicted MFS family arabinose efflux permease
MDDLHSWQHASLHKDRRKSMFLSWKKSIFRKRDAVALAIAMVLTIAALLQWWFWPLTLSMGCDIINPYFTTMDEAGNTYVINNGKSEILKINENGKIDLRLTYDNHEEDSFGEADELAIDEEGNLYVLDIQWNATGLGLAMERILKFDSKGHFQAVVFENDYSEVMVMKRHCFGLGNLDGDIVFASVEPDGNTISVYRLADDAFETVNEITYENAEQVQDISVVSDSQIYLINKNGQIFLNENGINTMVFASVGYQLPYYVTGDGETNYFTELCNRGIYQIDGQEVTLLYDSATLQEMTGIAMDESVLETLQSVSIGQNHLLCVTCDSAVAVIHLDDQSVKMLEHCSYIPAYQVMIILRVVFAVIAAVIALYYLIALIILLKRRGVLEKKKTSIILILAVAAAALVVMTSMLKIFKENYIDEQISMMCTVTQIAAETMDTAAVESVNYPSDYGSEAYQILQEDMAKLIDVSSEYSENLYCNIVKYNEVNDRCYAIAYLDNSIGAYYPLDSGEVEEAKTVYQTGERYINGGKEDATGSYVYVKNPLKDASGNVIGIVEIGMVSDTLSEMVGSMRTDIMIEIVLMLIIAVFVLNEVFAYGEDRKAWMTKTFPIHYLRIITFLCFAAYNMPTSFLPVYVEKFYTESLPFSIELAGSLPLTCNFALIGIMALFCPRFLQKVGFRVTMMLGAICSVCGDAAMALAGDYWVVFVGLMLNGVGCGLLMSGLSIIVAQQNDEEKTRGFSVMNGSILSGMICGTVIGATIAEKLGNSNMFYCSAGVWACIFIVLFLLGKAFGENKTSQNVPSKKEKRAKISDIFSGSILGFLLLVVVPYMIVNGFTSYFLPVFADNYGLGESQTSLLLVMNCLVGIFLSTTLTDLTMKYLRRGSIYLSSALSIGAVLLFGYFQNLYMLAFALFLMGVAKSFGAASREIYFCDQPKVQQIGEDRAMGYYNLADNLGESAGTIVFGGIMRIGLVTGTWILAGVSAGLLWVYGFVSKRKQK